VLTLGGFLAAFFLGRRYTVVIEPASLWDSEKTEALGRHPTFDRFESLCGSKLQSIAASVAKLQGLSEVVVRADDTYEEVYHGHLIRQDRHSARPEEREWNSFVEEARSTGPIFLEGKEAFRDAVANLHRLIRRAPDHLRNMIHYWRRHDADEAAWYLSKVIRLVESIQANMETASTKFANVEASVDGMTQDAQENVGHFQQQILQLESEAKELEEPGRLLMGKWNKHVDSAMTDCKLGGTTVGLDDCFQRCLQHSSKSCTSITYYKTAYFGHTCFIHCSSAKLGPYLEADTYVLERDPIQLSLEAARKREDGSLALQLQARWSAVRKPLAEVTHLARRFRGATMDLRKSLEEARFATNDLRQTWKGTRVRGPDEEALDEARLLERHIAEVVGAIEDLGGSLASLRFES